MSRRRAEGISVALTAELSLDGAADGVQGGGRCTEQDEGGQQVDHLMTP